MAKSKSETAAVMENQRPSVPEKANETAGEAETAQTARTSEKTVDAAAFQVTYPFGLNLRAGPGKGYPVLSVLPAGAEVHAAGERVSPPDGGTWLPVETRQGSGWVDAAYLRLTPEA